LDCTASKNPEKRIVPTEDFRINAAVRTTLVRFWIDTSQIDHGAINGVVYLRGRLTKELSRSHQEDEESIAFLARRLERELKNIRGVRDVVYNLDNLTKTRGRWMPRKVV
jgi:hypothetical protein